MRWLVASLAVTALLPVTLAGTVPIGEWFDPALMTPVAALGQLALAGLFIGAIVAATRARREVAGVRSGAEAPPDAGRRAA